MRVTVTSKPSAPEPFTTRFEPRGALRSTAYCIFGGLKVVFGPVSGAHLNPVVTVVSAFQRETAWRHVAPYVAVQVAGAFLGVAAANLMFEEPHAFFASTRARQGPGQLLGEAIATFGLLATILGCARRRPSAIPFAVAAYIGAAYWFTASTSFANPAVTVARSLTDTFAGIRPADAPGFIVAQLLGAAAATALFRWLVPTLPAVATRVVAKDVDRAVGRRGRS